MYSRRSGLAEGGPSGRYGASRRLSPRAVVVVTLVCALGMVPAACSSPPDDARAVSTPSSVVLKPGKPGEKAATVAPEDFEDAPAEDRWNEADADFMTGMIRHHDQAVAMTSWVPDRSASKQVKALADRMHATQRAEIDLMSDWLTARERPVPPRPRSAGNGTGPRVPEADHDHELMPGMLTDAELDAMEAATGPEFDRLFLNGMITHHQGAIAMCSDIASSGIDQEIQQLAANIGVDQAAEIARMNDLLDELP